MLKCIWYLVSESFFHRLMGYRRRMEEKLAGTGITLRLQKLSDWSWPEGLSGEAWPEGLSAGSWTKELSGEAAERTEGPWQEKRQEILFISDSREMTQVLLAKGCFTVALYHEENENESFPGIRYAVMEIEELTPASYEEAYCRVAGLPLTVLKTERLLVRESTLADVEEFYRIYGEPSITCYLKDLCEDHHREREYMKLYIDKMYGFYGFGIWSVLRRDTGRLIGRAGLDLREGYDLPQLGFVIEASQQHQGYGYEVCREILNYAAQVLAFDRVQAMVKEQNEGSRRLLARLGFREVSRVSEKGEEYLLLEVQTAGPFSCFGSVHGRNREIPRSIF